VRNYIQLTASYKMEEPGQKLKRARERLNLRFRDVEEASQRLAARHKNPEYAIALSRLSDIENRGTVPSIYRVYSLCVIYRLSFTEVVNWYGVRLAEVPADSARMPIPLTHAMEDVPHPEGHVAVPIGLENISDFRKTSFLNRYIREWGQLPLQMLSGLDFQQYKYGFIGADDWSMYPVLAPGSLVQIDDSKKKIATTGWLSEYDRPIYFMEHRNGYECSWCSLAEGYLILQPHASSHLPSRYFKYPEEVEILGQVVGVAMRLDQGKRRRTRS
jgi:transcriptional regulator with XRE-family HTH domain